MQDMSLTPQKKPNFKILLRYSYWLYCHYGRDTEACFCLAQKQLGMCWVCTGVGMGKSWCAFAHLYTTTLNKPT